MSPAQVKNLEDKLEKKVLDRSELILAIFAEHARTRESRLQVELAQLEYLLPRLTRMWGHLSRQQGGIGTRGPGETQLEVDRDRVTAKVAEICEPSAPSEGVRKMYFQNPQLLGQVENAVIEVQVVAWLVDKATVEITSMTFTELMTK